MQGWQSKQVQVSAEHKGAGHPRIGLATDDWPNPQSQEVRAPMSST